MAKILIVDDHASNRALVVTLIHHAGHQPLEAADGAEALVLVRAERPELVISDILMPTMDGYEFVRQLRADPELAATEVVFYTAHYREREAQSLARACGVSRVIVKPCEPESILLAIRESLAHIPQEPVAPDSTEFDRDHLRLVTDKLSEKLDDLKSSNRRLAALTDLNLHLASEHDPHVLLDEVCRGARDLFSAKYAVLGVTDKSGTGKASFFASGIEPAILRNAPQPQLGAGLFGKVCAERHPIRMINPDGNPTAVGLPSGYPSLHSCLITPIASLANLYGWICLVDKMGATEFSDEDEQIASILSAQVGRIYENGSLYAMVQRHAVQLEVEVNERKRATEELQAKEAGLHRAQLMAKLSHVVSGPEGEFESWSDNMPEMIDVDPAQMIKTTRDWIKIIHPADRELFRTTAIEAGIRGTRSDPIEYRLRRSDGIWIHVRQVMDPLQGPEYAQSKGRWFNTIQDVTEQKQAESKILRLNRVYAVLSGINVLIVHTRDRDELFKESCHIAVEHGRFKMAWLGVVDQETMMIVPASSSGVGPEFLAFIKDRFSLREDTPFGNTMSARAIREKKPVVLNEIRDDSASLFAKERYEQGILSMAFLPLLVSDKAVGVLALYADEINFFDEEEMRLLTELAGDIGFALDHIEKEERLSYLAYYDVLTGLPNRTLFLEQLGQQLRASDNDNTLIALALVDISRFRIINDTFGRQASDELLKMVTQRIRQCDVNLDTVARVGANCFGVVLRSTLDAGAIAHSIEKLLRGCFSKPFRLHDSDLRISGKSGISLHPLDGENAEALLANAEVALLRAKVSAEPLVFYAPEMNSRVADALNLESKLRTALELGQFVLYYQPKISVATGKLTGAEALIRWNDPESGLVPPGSFIPILEETGLIYEVGRWALGKTVEDGLRWRAAGLTPIRIAVNVSPLQLRHRDFVAEVAQVISVDERAADGLELEITESVIMNDVQSNIEKLKAIRDMGVNVAIDDFGTGYSSLAYLAKLPANTLKIDRSFVVDMTTGPQGLALVATIISLSHSLGLKVIAEGIETEEQSRLLRLLNCDEMQGYLFSKPVPSDIFERTYLTATPGV